MKLLEILSLTRDYNLAKYLFVFLFILTSFSMKGQVKVGDSIPNFELFNHNSKWFNSNDVKKEKGVVFFFFKGKPSKKNTILLEYKKKYSLFQNLNVKVIAIGEDVIENVHSFYNTYKIPFNILSDSRGLALELFGMDEKKLNKGNRGFTFVVKNGKIIYIANIKENIENQIYSALGKFIK